MPRINPQQVELLLKVLDLTRDTEMSCDECLPRLAELVENEMVGKEPGPALRLVEEHLALCPCCAEEVEALREALKAIAPPAG